MSWNKCKPSLNILNKAKHQTQKILRRGSAAIKRRPRRTHNHHPSLCFYLLRRHHAASCFGLPFEVWKLKKQQRGPPSDDNERVRKPCTHCVSISRKFLIGFMSKAICSAGTRQRDEPRGSAQGRAFVYHGLQVLNVIFSVSGIHHSSWKKV